MTLAKQLSLFSAVSLLSVIHAADSDWESEWDFVHPSAIQLEVS